MTAHLFGMLQIVAVALGQPPVDCHLDPDDLVHDAADMPCQLDKVSIYPLVLHEGAHLNNTQMRPAEQCDSRVAPALKQVQCELVLGVDDPYEQQPRGLQRGHRQRLYVCIRQLAVAKRHTCRSRMHQSLGQHRLPDHVTTPGGLGFPGTGPPNTAS